MLGSLSSSPLRCYSLCPPRSPQRRRLHVSPLSQPPQRGCCTSRKRRGRNNDRENIAVASPSAAAAASLSSDPLFLSSLSSLSSETGIMPLSLSFLHLTPGEKHALTLSTLAGMSTTLGALIAIIRRPSAADLAFLLGVALGVMGVLSVCEMWVHNALENGIAPVSLAFAGGAAAYCLLAPLLPEVSAAAGGRWGLGEDAGGTALVDAAEREKLSAAAASSSSSSSSSAAATRGAGPRRGPAPAAAEAKTAAASSKELPPPPPPLSPAELLRLGLVVAVAMTAHNLPEGFAVAFSSFTPLGPTMVVAIAAHNIPEGVVVAAPVFAATGSRLAALALAAASGMSEPVGAAAALFLARPWLPGAAGEAGSSAASVAAAGALAASRLSLVLAASGGVMAAVCAVDLFPQGRKCAAPSRLAVGSVLGAAAMAATLALGV